MNRDQLRLGFKVALAGLAALIAGGVAVRTFEANQLLHRRQAAVELAGVSGHLLQERVDRALSATYALAAVLRQGNGRLDHFEPLADEMLRIYGGISSLQLAPAGVVSQIVPLAGNEAAIGHDLLRDPKRRKESLAAIDSRRLTLAGPFTLRQGGVAVVGRLPVFVDTPVQGERFWGFTIALIRISDLLAAARLDGETLGEYAFELSRIHPDSGAREVFASTTDAPLQSPVAFAIEVPNGKWTLNLAPRGGWDSPPAVRAAEVAVVLLIAGLLSLLTFHVLKQPAELRREVARRTEELRERKRIEAALQAEKTAQLALIAKLEAAQNQLLQSEKMAAIGQLAAGVAHEINNPVGFIQSNLGSLNGYIDDLLQLVDAYEAQAASRPDLQAAVADARAAADLQFLREDLPSLLAETRDGIVRIRGIVQDLKDFAHVGSQVWQAADLHHGLDSTLNVVWNELKYKAEVVKAYGELPAVDCIASQLNQVFMNLLVNAAHAIEQRGVITIRTGRRDDEVWVEVADTGRGIAPEHRARIFEPFFTTKPVGKGTGLGLSLSYSIVTKHRGRIEVESEVGRGSTFRVWLPIHRPPESPPTDAAAHAVAAG